MDAVPADGVHKLPTASNADLDRCCQRSLVAQVRTSEAWAESPPPTIVYQGVRGSQSDTSKGYSVSRLGLIKCHQCAMALTLMGGGTIAQKAALASQGRLASAPS